MKLAPLLPFFAWLALLSCTSSPPVIESPTIARYERLLDTFELAPAGQQAALDTEARSAVAAGEALFHIDGRSRWFEGSPSSEPIERLSQLAERGSPRALRWLVENDGVLGVALESRERLRRVGLTVLCTHCADEPWALELCRALPILWINTGDALMSLSVAYRRALPQIEPAYRALIEHAARPEVREVARFEFARMLQLAYESRRDTPAELVEARELFAALARDATAPELARDARRSHFALDRLREGMLAPSVATEDVDGVPFRLEDYRGRVVLLLFWGFW